MNTLSFEDLPKVVLNLQEKLDSIERLLINFPKHQEEKKQEKLLSVREAAQFLKLTVPTIYSKVSKGELPVMKKGKRLYFSSTELVEYLKSGRIKSNSELEAEANAHINKLKKGRL